MVAVGASHTRIIRRVFIGSRLPTQPFVSDARASFARESAGSGWFAIGDARLAIDSLAGQGLVRAIEDGILAVTLLTNESFVHLWNRRTSADRAAYVSAYHEIYALEGRWLKEAYWRTATPCLTDFKGNRCGRDVRGVG